MSKISLLLAFFSLSALATPSEDVHKAVTELLPKTSSCERLLGFGG